MTSLAKLPATLSLEQVLETIPSGLFVVDPQQRVICWNAEAERITGYSAAEALGRHCSFLSGIPCGRSCGLFNPELPKPITGIPCSIRRKDGRRILLAKNVDYLRDREGKVVGGIESFIDITRRRHLEKRLRNHSRQLEQAVRQRTAQLEKERSRLGTVLDSMEDLAYLVGSDYRLHFINRSMQQVFGPVQGELCYQALYERAGALPLVPAGAGRSTARPCARNAASRSTSAATRSSTRRCAPPRGRSRNSPSTATSPPASRPRSSCGRPTANSTPSSTPSLTICAAR